MVGHVHRAAVGRLLSGESPHCKTQDDADERGTGMGNDYRRVEEALKAGASPEHLCMTCPWDRYCVSPPTMTHQDIDTKLKEAEAKDDAHDRAVGRKDMPMGMLLTAVMYAGKDLSTEICPVLALRLRSSDGRVVSDNLKAIMKEL